jgi:hypothetical protein
MKFLSNRILYFSFYIFLNSTTKLNKKTMRNFTPPPQTASKTKMPKAFLLALLTLMSCIITPHWGSGGLFAQLTLPSGVVNTYQPVSAVAGSTITLTGTATGATHTFAAGDRVLLVQMTGLTSANGGKFEFVTLAAGTTASSLVTTTAITRAYTPATEKVQAIWVPYDATSITVPAGGISALKWNGTTGGIVAILTPGTLTLNGAINADGAGFRHADGTNTINGTDIYYGGGGGSLIFGTGGGGGGYGSAGKGGATEGITTGGNANDGTFNGGISAVLAAYPHTGGGGGGGGVGGSGSGGAAGPHGGGGGGGAGYAGGGNGGEGSDNNNVVVTGGLGSIGATGDTDGSNVVVIGNKGYGGGGGGGNRYTGGGAGYIFSAVIGGKSGTNGGASFQSPNGNGGGITPAAYNQYQYCDGSFNCPDPRIWMAGGGQNTTQGGGIVLVNAGTIIANTNTISANGDAGVILFPTKGASGGGGGGGGGLLVINTQSISSGPLSLCAKGGRGAKGLTETTGSIATQHGGGSGGSGGGGLVWVQDPLGGVGRNNATGTPPGVTNITFCIDGGPMSIAAANPKTASITGTGGGGGNGAVMANSPIGIFESCSKPYAGTDQTLCAGNIVTLTGTSPSTGIWAAQTDNPIGSTISTSTAGVATATFTAAAVGNFNYIYTAGTCTDTVNVTVLAKPSAGIDQTLCAGSKATLKGTIPTTGTWTAKADNPTAVTLSTSVAGVATATFGTLDVGVYNFIYTAGTCSDTLKVINPKPDAGIDQTLCGGNAATLTGTSLTTGTWTAQSGNPAGASLSTSVAGVAKATFTTAAAGIFNFIYTADGCTDTLKVTATAKPSAGIDQTLCAGSKATLKGTIPTTGTWTAKADNPTAVTLSTSVAGVATATFGTLDVGVYNFIYTAGTCSDTLKVTVNPKPDAGIDQTLCGGNAATLTGTSLTTGTWTAQSGNPAGASLSTSVAGVAKATFTTAAAGNFNFIYTAGGCTDTLKVTATAKPSAGIDQTLCAGSKVTLKGTIPTTGTWTAKADNPTAVTLSTSVAGVATATFGIVDVGIYNFIYTAGTCSDTLKVTVNPKPDAGIDQTLCGGNVATLTGTSLTTGTWTAQSGNPAGASLSTSVAGVAKATFTTAAAGVFNFIYTAGGCTDTLKVTATAKPFAGIDQASICVGVLPITTATLAATAISGGVWTQKASNPVGAIITTPSVANSGITGLNPGNYEFIWTVATCSDTVKFTIQSCSAPCSKVSIYSKVQTICEGGTPKAFTALPSSGVNYAWYGPLADTTSTLGTAIASATLATYTPTGSFAVGTKYYAVIGSNGTCSDTAFAALTVITKPAAIKLCPNESYTITAEAGATAIQWYKDGVAVKDSTKSTFVVKSIGTYTYSAIKANSDMCRDTLCCPHIFEACVLGGGSIGDYVFLDNDNSNTQSAGDTPVKDVKVYLLNSLGVKIDSTTTGTDGKYLFSNLPLGTYSVQFVAPAGQSFVTPLTGGDPAKDSDAGVAGKSAPITLTAATPDVLTLDAGIKPAPKGSIGDYVFLDNDNSNTQSAGDTPVKDVKVYLLNSLGVKIDSTTTGTDGKYLFSNLPLGTYSVQFVAPAGQSFVTPLTGGDPAKDSDAGVAGKSAPITLTAAIPDVLTLDAGLKPVVVIPCGLPDCLNILIKKM